MPPNTNSVVKAASATQAAASTVDTVNFTRKGDFLQILNFASVRLYFTIAGSSGGTGADAGAATPTVAGADCYCVMPNSGLTVGLDSNAVSQVKLISAGAMDYTAQVF